MAKCDFCGEEIAFPFVCNYCGGSYCVKHRLPESHNCTSPKETSQRVKLETSEKETQEDQVKEPFLMIRGIVGEELFEHMQKYGSMEIWELWVKDYVRSKLLELELENLGGLYGIERKGDSDEHFLLKVKAYEYLSGIYDFVKVETEVKPPSTKGRPIYRQGDRMVAEAHGAPAIDLYLTTKDGKRIWVEAETNVRNVEKDIQNANTYSEDYDEFYIITTTRAYDKELLHPFNAQSGHFLLYDENSDTTQEVHNI